MHDPLVLFRETVNRMNARDFAGVAALCDPVSLRAFKRAVLSDEERIAKRPAPVSAEEWVRRDPTVAFDDAVVRADAYRQAYERQQPLSARFQGISTIDALELASPAEVFAAYLGACSPPPDLTPLRAELRVPDALVDQVLALDSRRLAYSPFASVRVNDTIVLVLYRDREMHDEVDFEDWAREWLEAERVRVASLPDDERLLHDALADVAHPKFATCRLQPDGGVLMLAVRDFVGYNAGIMYGWEPDEDEAPTADAAAGESHD